MLIDNVYTFVILNGMKTAISLPDRVFFEAEKTAQNLGVSRSTLYLNALTEYLIKYNRKNITQMLNEVYNDDYYKEFEPISNAALESIRELTKNDTW
jgi:metal-responsive CopG/Arc/MetJ family transcriptional regulator